MTASADRISQVKTLASEKLKQKRQVEEADRKRIEEEKRIASIRVTIKGGAWLTKKAGNSETLRGLKIFVLRTPAKKEQLLAMLQATLDGDKARLKAAKNKVSDWEKTIREDSNDNVKVNIDQSLLEEAKQEVARREGCIALREDTIKTKSKAIPAPVDMETIFKESILSILPRGALFPDITRGALFPELSQEATQHEMSVWAAICSQQLAAEAHTDVDGKYSVEVAGGKYYLYAMFDSSYSVVEWFVPVKISESKDVAIDLHNDNASRITNKHD